MTEPLPDDIERWEDSRTEYHDTDDVLGMEDGPMDGYAVTVNRSDDVKPYTTGRELDGIDLLVRHSKTDLGATVSMPRSEYRRLLVTGRVGLEDSARLDALDAHGADWMLPEKSDHGWWYVYGTDGGGDDSPREKRPETLRDAADIIRTRSGRASPTGGENG